MRKNRKSSKKVLDRVNFPQDLKALSLEELKLLASEIRELIIETVSKTGGHLAPNLGVVELTIALHRVLDSPKDKIIWDVGHQCYPHKILTGRKDKFPTLRQYKGLGGFPKKEESAHDIFDTGHASSSISVALGLAEARDRQGRDEVIVAVIGDGSLTGGMAYEALNQTGHLKTNLIVILNDNEMSIASNVGALSSYLSRIRLDPAYNKLKHEIEEHIKKIPAVGEWMYEVGEHIKDSLKQFVVPGMLFEELGFKYIGPIDGHDITSIEQNLNLARQVEGPVLLHLLTKKGLGYKPAEENPDKFHGVSPFNIKTGESEDKNLPPTYTEVFGKTLTEIARIDERIIAITAAMSSGTGLNHFREVFPERFYDVGICEQHAVTFAASLALGGFLPVVAIYSTFLERAYDQVIQDVCLQKLHVIFALDRAGLVGEDGPTHHGVFDLSYLRHIPGLVLMSPQNGQELRHMLYTATKIASPVAIRYPRGRTEAEVDFLEPFKMLEIGKAEVLFKGKKVAILALGRMVEVSAKTAELLNKKGISCTVVNARFVKPLDETLITSLANSHEVIVTVEENSLLGGFGSAVLEFLNSASIQKPVLRLGLPDEFITHGAPEILLAKSGLNVEGVAFSVEKFLRESFNQRRIFSFHRLIKG